MLYCNVLYCAVLCVHACVHACMHWEPFGVGVAQLRASRSLLPANCRTRGLVRQHGLWRASRRLPHPSPRVRLARPRAICDGVLPPLLRFAAHGPRAAIWARVSSSRAHPVSGRSGEGALLQLCICKSWAVTVWEARVILCQRGKSCAGTTRARATIEWAVNANLELICTTVGS